MTMLCIAMVACLIPAFIGMLPALAVLGTFLYGILDTFL